MKKVFDYWVSVTYICKLGLFSIVWNPMSLLVKFYNFKTQNTWHKFQNMLCQKKRIHPLAPFPWNISNPLFLWLPITHSDNGTLTSPTYPRDFNPTTPRTPGCKTASHFVGRFSTYLPSGTSTIPSDDIYWATLHWAPAGVLRVHDFP